MPARAGASAERVARVLIVESDTGRCARIARAFAREGYTVDAAHTPQEALTKARETSVHAAMINAHLEDGDGGGLPTALTRIQPAIACIVINKRAYSANSIEPREML